MYEKILVAVALQNWDEFSPHALAVQEAAIALAKGSGAKLSVLSVYDYGHFKELDLPSEMAARYREDHMTRIDSLMETKMKQFVAGMQGLDVLVAPLLRVGEPRKEIISMAETLQPDVLLIGAHSKRSVLDVMLGGTAAYVSRHAPCPVVMVKPAAKLTTPRGE